MNLEEKKADKEAESFCVLWCLALSQVIGLNCKNTPKNLVVSQKTLIFADKKGDTIMNTIAIDSNIYKGAESYAKLHNISVTAAIEKAISLFCKRYNLSKSY